MRISTLVLGLAALSPRAGAGPGTIDTYAGTGRAATAGADPGGGDGGLARSTPLGEPFHCDLDGRGDLYIADATAHRVRKVDAATGRIATVAGDGRAGSDGDGGPATSARIDTPYAVAVDGRTADLYIVQQRGRVVRKVDGKSGVISTLAVPAVTAAAGAAGGPLVEPNDACLDGRGGLLVADVGDWRVRRVDLATGAVTTFAGRGKDARSGHSGDGGPATQAVIAGARGVCVDGRGNTYICEREGNSIRKVDPAGLISTVAGTGRAGYSGDGGDATKATFRGPKGVRCDREGNLYVVDTENHAIRRVDARAGTIATVAGGRKGDGGGDDGGDATKAGLDRPHGCVVAADGTLFIADSNNHRVARVTPR